MDLFAQIEKPDETLYKLYFSACAQLSNKQALVSGKRIFSQLTNNYHKNVDLVNCVLTMFIKCDDIESSQSLFARMSRNLTSYRLMMKMYNMKDEPEKTMNLFEQMKQENIQPNDIIFSLLIDACSHIGDYSLCQAVISQMSPDLSADRWIQNGLVDMWVGFFRISYLWMALFFSDARVKYLLLKNRNVSSIQFFNQIMFHIQP